jgi:2-phospho-L-lactate/phosphoenolpyruvate guanylyltransferase
MSEPRSCNREGAMDALIPLKHLDDAKSRLSKRLSPSARRRLMQMLLKHTVCEVRCAPTVGRVILVSSDPDAPALAAQWSIEHFDDRSLPWNDGLAAAIVEVVQSQTVLICSADLPFVTAEDVEAFVRRAPRPGVAIARARDAGTNAVVMSPPGSAPTCFGVVGSAAQHKALTEAAGLPAEIVDLPNLAFDLDSLEDLELVLQRANISADLRAILAGA